LPRASTRGMSFQANAPIFPQRRLARLRGAHAKACPGGIETSQRKCNATPAWLQSAGSLFLEAPTAVDISAMSLRSHHSKVCDTAERRSSCPLMAHRWPDRPSLLQEWRSTRTSSAHTSAR
jgi:hypothetical protein